MVLLPELNKRQKNKNRKKNRKGKRPAQPTWPTWPSRGGPAQRGRVVFSTRPGRQAARRQPRHGCQEAAWLLPGRLLAPWTPRAPPPSLPPPLEPSPSHPGELPAKTRAPPSPPTCADVATSSPKPRRLVQSIQHRRLRRIPASIGAELHQGRRPRRGSTAGRRGEDLKIAPPPSSLRPSVHSISITVSRASFCPISGPLPCLLARSRRGQWPGHRRS